MLSWQAEEGHGDEGEPGRSRVPQSLQQADGGDDKTHDPRECLDQCAAREDVRQDNGTDPGERRVETAGKTAEATHRDARGEREGTGQEEHQQPEGGSWQNQCGRHWVVEWHSQEWHAVDSQCFDDVYVDCIL